MLVKGALVITLSDLNWYAKLEKKTSREWFSVRFQQISLTNNIWLVTEAICKDIVWESYSIIFSYYRTYYNFWNPEGGGGGGDPITIYGEQPGLHCSCIHNI